MSSATQRERDTIASQLRVLPEFVDRQGWSLVRPIATYVDDGHTAKSGHLEARLGLAALLRDATAGVFDVVVVVDIDRLTRSEDLAERGAILGALQRAGVRVASASTGQVLDLSTSIGDLFGSLQAFFAAEENRKRRERTKAGKVTAIQRGRKPSGPTPFGLRYDRTTGVWSIDEVRADVYREIFERVAGGESCVRIADDLLDRGAPGPRGLWSRAKVYRLVRSRHAVGQWRADRGRHMIINVPPIIDEALWQRAQAALIAHGKRGLRRTKHVYLLEGLAVCGACGAPVLIRSASPARNGRTNPAAYVCRRRKLEIRGEVRCDARIVPCAEGDARVWAAIARELDDPEISAELGRRHAARTADQHGWQRDADGYRATVARLQRVEEALAVRFRRGALTEATFDGELAAIHRERAIAITQLGGAERAIAGIGLDTGQPAGTWVEALRSLATAATTPEMRLRIVRQIIERGGAVLDDGRIKLTLLVVAASRDAYDGKDVPMLALADRNRSTQIYENELRIRVVA